MLEADAVQRVVELDIDAEIVGIELELVAGLDPAILGDVERERRHVPVERQPPMPVAVGMGLEIDHGANRLRRMPGGV